MISDTLLQLGEACVLYNIAEELLCSCSGRGEMSVRSSRRSLRTVTTVLILLFVNIAGTAAEDEDFSAEVCTSHYSPHMYINMYI